MQLEGIKDGGERRGWKLTNAILYPLCSMTRSQNCAIHIDYTFGKVFSRAAKIYCEWKLNLGEE